MRINLGRTNSVQSRESWNNADAFGSVEYTGSRFIRGSILGRR